MNNPAVRKYLQVALIAIAVIVVDQWTKHLASTRLASHEPGRFTNDVTLTVSAAYDGKTLKAFVIHEFGGWNSPAEIDGILRDVTSGDDGVLLDPGHIVHKGDTVDVAHRKIVVVPEHFDLEYTRNTGAAFSFLANAKSPMRVPFFIVISLLAVVLMLWLLRGVDRSQQLLVWGFSLVCGGAIGNNLFDRPRLGYVVDFIVWKWTDMYRWPTFNIADSAICVGVSLILLQMIVDAVRKSDQETAPGYETEEVSE